MSKILKLKKKYWSNDDGQVAVIFSLVLLPVVLITSVAVDSHRQTALNARLATALDSSALAAVTNQTLSESERADYAETYFRNNISRITEKVNFSVIESGADRVVLEASAELNTSFLGIIGQEFLQVKERAAAEVTQGDVICMLALDPDGERSFEITGGAILSAPNCSVQVNSTHEDASVIDHGGVGTAKDFCVTGGADGNFIPFVNTECRAVEDPFKMVTAPKAEPCMDKEVVNNALTSWQSEAGGVTLTPGTYCGGIVLYNKVVDFEPGTYVIKDGPLIFDNGSRVTAEGVTFVFQGKRARLITNEGSKVNLKAPKEGQFANLAFYQDTSYQGIQIIYPYGEYGDPKYFLSGYGYSDGYFVDPDVDKPSGSLIETRIRRGSDLSVIGVVYLPKQKIRFSGGSLLENQAPATSFIGYQISIGDGSKIHVDVDHVAGNINPIEPRSDETARLVE